MRALNTLPNPRPLVAAAFALVVAATPAQALFTGALPMNKCVGEKMNCIKKAKTCLLKCHTKALGTGTAADPVCLAKCRDRFEGDHSVTDRGCFAKREELGGCGPAVGDAGTFAARIDADIQEIVRQINPTGGTPDNDCAARKLACVSKYDACLLTVARKATKDGTPIGDLSKCTAILDGTDASCIGKLEAKYCDPASPGCTSTRPPCLTRDDQGLLRNQDDAFVDDVIQALAAGPTDLDTQRCSGDNSVTCSSAPGGVAGCGGPLGTCEFFVGPPQPLNVAFAICAISQWQGPITGTFDEATGASSSTAAVVTRTYAGPLDQPCPICAGDTYTNDGSAGGTCTGGARTGLACDGNGRSSQPSYGTTSLDCPPSAGSLVATSVLNLSSGNDGSVAKTVTAASPICNGAPGKRCLCATCSLDSTIACENDAQCASASAGTCTNAAGEPRKPNWCLDDTTVPGDGTRCAAVGGGEGFCPEGPANTHCAIEPFRGCLTNGDCPAPNDRCIAPARDCFAGYNGNVGDTLIALGATAPARNGAAAVTVGTLACHPATTSSWINVGHGYPGPVRWVLDGVSENDGGPACPTRLSFLPTSKGPAFDPGWTGFLHDQRQIGDTKVTVATTCTGTHPNCACSYAGPIANPNAP